MRGRISQRSTSGMAVAMILTLGLVGCAGEDEALDSQSTATPSATATFAPPGSKVSGEGSSSPSQDATPSASPTATADDKQSSTDQALADGVENPRADQYRDEGASSSKDTSGAKQAFGTAKDAGDALDDGISASYAAPDTGSELDQLGFDWWLEREQAIGERFAEIATDFRPGEDFNREDALIRASHLLHESIRPTEIWPYKATDESWQSAITCNAKAEVFVEHQAIDESAGVALPSFEVVAEYRWVDGKKDCKLIQPDYFYRYELSLDGDGMIRRMDQSIIDDTSHERPSGWDI